MGKKLRTPKSSTNRKADSSAETSHQSENKKPWKEMSRQERELANLAIRTRVRTPEGDMLPDTDHCDFRSWYHDRISVDTRIRMILERYNEFKRIMASPIRKFPARLIDELDRLEFEPPLDLIRMGISNKYRGTDSCRDIYAEQQRIQLPSNILAVSDWREHRLCLLTDEDGTEYYSIMQDDPQSTPNIPSEHDDAQESDHGDSHEQTDCTADDERERKGGSRRTGKACQTMTVTVRPRATQ